MLNDGITQVLKTSGFEIQFPYTAQDGKMDRRKNVQFQHMVHEILG